MPDIKLNTTFGNANLPVVQYPGFHDDFSGADGVLDYTLDGAPWLKYESGVTPGAWVRTSGKAKCNSGSGTNLAVVDALTADGTVTQTIGAVGTGHLGGLVFRAVDINNYYYVRWRAGGADFRYSLYKVVGGTLTGVATAASATSADGDVLSVELSGTSIVVKVNGATILSPAAQTDLQTATKHGLYSNSVDFTPTYEQIEFVPVGGTPQL